VVSLLGAGNVLVSAPALATLITFEDQEWELRLFDAHEERLDLADLLARTLNDGAAGSRHRIRSSNDPAEMLEDAEPEAPPVIPPVTEGVGQEYVVPAGTRPFKPFAGIELNDAPEQIVSEMLETEAAGFTAMARVNEAPLHAPAVGEIVYVAV